MSETVILYSNNCPNCKKLKMLLDSRRISYTENNSVEEMIELGFTKTPVLSVDGINMGYDDAKHWVIENSKGEIE